MFEARENKLPPGGESLNRGVDSRASERIRQFTSRRSFSIVGPDEGRGIETCNLAMDVFKV
jgi:hypothetical protein